MTEYLENHQSLKDVKKRKVGIELPKLQLSNKFKIPDFEDKAHRLSTPHNLHLSSHEKNKNYVKSMTNIKPNEGPTQDIMQSKYHSRNSFKKQEMSMRLHGQTIKDITKNHATNLEKSVLDNSFYQEMLQKYQTLNSKKQKNSHHSKKKATAINSTLQFLQDPQRPEEKKEQFTQQKSYHSGKNIDTQNKPEIFSFEHEESQSDTKKNIKREVPSYNMNIINPTTTNTNVQGSSKIKSDTLKMFSNKLLQGINYSNNNRNEDEEGSGFVVNNPNQMKSEKKKMSMKNLLKKSFGRKKVIESSGKVPFIGNFIESEIQNSKQQEQAAIASSISNFEVAKEDEKSEASNKTPASKKSKKKGFRLFCCL